MSRARDAFSDSHFEGTVEDKLSGAKRPVKIPFRIVVADADTMFGEIAMDERALSKWQRKRYLDKNGAITERGWVFMNEARDKMDLNLVEWMNDFFHRAKATDELDGFLVGDVWVDPKDPDQVQAAVAAEELGLTINDDWPAGLREAAYRGAPEFGVDVFSIDELGPGLHFGEWE